VPHLIGWRGGFGDPSVVNPSAQHTICFDLAAQKLVTKDVKAAKNGTVTSEGNFSFAGVEDTYFTAAFLPAAAPRYLSMFVIPNAREGSASFGFSHRPVTRSLLYARLARVGGAGPTFSGPMILAFHFLSRLSCTSFTFSEFSAAMS
jgi:hypothetical protein